jgi:DNA processing protein
MPAADPTLPPPPNDEERLAWLRLIRSEHVGPITFRRLLDRFGSASAALAALPDLARRGNGGRPRPYPRGEAEAELARARACGARLLAWPDPDYPPLLLAIDDAPPLIYVLGDATRLAAPAIAVVGSRNASLNGRRLAEQLARDLGGSGFVVVSGLARGIDTAAHHGALRTGTAAVLAGGVDIVYPEQNRDLYRRILDAGGAVVAEQPPGTLPQARHFPRRNRLISGLARGVVVVEASLHSGSLITARLALEQGREVFAVPGSPLDPRARGGNDLIRQGATLTETADDVLRALAGRPAVLPSPAPPPARPAAATTMASGLDTLVDEPAMRHRVIQLLSPAPVAVDEIVRECHLSPAAVNTILLELELAGRIERQSGNRIALIAPASDGGTGE